MRRLSGEVMHSQAQEALRDEELKKRRNVYEKGTQMYEKLNFLWDGLQKKGYKIRAGEDGGYIIREPLGGRVTCNNIEELEEYAATRI